MYNDFKYHNRFFVIVIIYSFILLILLIVKSIGINNEIRVNVWIFLKMYQLYLIFKCSKLTLHNFLIIQNFSPSHGF